MARVIFIFRLYFHSVLGIIVSFEGLVGVETIQHERLLIYLIGVSLYGIMAFFLGILAYNGEVIVINCTLPSVLDESSDDVKSNFEVCQNSIRLYALIQFFSVKYSFF